MICKEIISIFTECVCFQEFIEVGLTMVKEAIEINPLVS